ncbi:IS66-like element accessory protein TnpA [Azospirillum canadense]|uniref:IS66-like element accessory protein TnpA n=1 Tax=Azospirillum canadense TaxID=403962 RepID=UPI002227EDD0|nr:transposase [Azospirillum canadense]MCW2242096.1 transposase [Azospirillum canadense]
MPDVPIDLPINGHSFRRIEVLTGERRRRSWSLAQKAQIVAESQQPGAVVAEIALRYGLHRNQLYAWRREWQQHAERSQPNGFLAVGVADTGDSEPARASIDILIGPITVRVAQPFDAAALRQVLEVVRSVA